ncbi:MAG: methyltransferase domain-containing protein [Rhodospirillaceae bacterium]|nr:methyltransferase domain-containing protein [Rhodospirillaceae bacterium]
MGKDFRSATSIPARVDLSQILDIFGTTTKRTASERQAHLAKPSPPPGYGYDYFDNPAYIGYGGYRYDGRYRAAAERMRDQFGLKPGSKILEVGCAKGFILYEFHVLGMDVTGLDASAYAIANAKPEIRDRLQLHSSADLPFNEREFDFVLAKEVLPHLSPVDAIRLVREIMRVGRASFLEIQCANTLESAELMKRWDQTHQTIRSESWWYARLADIGYEGAFHCRELF